MTVVKKPRTNQRHQKPNTLKKFHEERLHKI